MTTTISPRQHDEKLAALGAELDRAEYRRDSITEQVHREIGDRRQFRFTRQERWTLSHAEAVGLLRDTVSRLSPEDAIYGSSHPANILRDYDAAVAETDSLLRQIGQMEDVYRLAPWPRYFRCLNTDGHIHSSMRDCPTVRWDTPMGWNPHLSGKTTAEAVADLGPTLCSVCFPEAPAEWRQRKSDVEREARKAAKTQREAAKLIKNLRKEEQFRDHHNWWVTTVAGCKQALRDERELFYYYGTGPHPWHAASVRAAGMAAQVLLAREAAQAGTGATQAEIDQIIARADKKWRSA